MQHAFFQKEHVVAERRLVHVGRRHHRAHLPRAHVLFENGPEFPARQRIHPNARLIQEQQFGTVQQRTGKPQLLLHAPREFSGGAFRKFRKIRHGEKLREPRLPLRLPEPEQIRVKQEILHHGQVFIEPELLRHIADQQLRLRPADANRFAQHRHGALLRRENPRRNAHQSRFASAVRSHERRQFAFGRFKRDVLQQGRRRSFFRAGDVREGKRCRHAVTPP